MKNDKQPKQSDKQGSEVAADAARADNKPKIHGEQWEEAQAHGDQLVSDSSLEDEADTRVESSGEQAGMARGEKPRKSPSREK